MHFQTFKRVILSLLALGLATLACNFLRPGSADSPIPAPFQSQEQSESAEQELCFNPLLPVKHGTTWTYNSTGSFEGNYSFTDTTTDVRDDGFTVISQFDDLARTQEWLCKPEGLVSLTFGSGPAAGITASGVQMDLTTSNVQGVNLPKTVNVGDQWSHFLDFEGNINVTGTSADVQGTATYTFNTIGEESVTVPAGTFDAMKIHVETVFAMQVVFSGIQTPAEFTSASDVWFAPDVGWVKAIGSSDLMGTTYNEIIELQSYNIP